MNALWIACVLTGVAVVQRDQKAGGLADAR